MRRALQIVLFYLMLAWLGAMLLAGNLTFVPLALLPARWREPLLQWLISATFRVFLGGCAACGLVRLDLSSLDAVNQAPGGLLLVANHPSMIDVVLVISRLRQALCLMKASLAGNAFLGVGAWLAGYITNRRVDAMIRAAAGAAAAGQRLLIFPEGTRTLHQPVGRITHGVGLIARMSGVPLQLVFIRTNSHYLAKGWPIWRPPQFPLLYQARLGERLQPGATPADTAHALQQRFEQELGASIDPGLHF